MSVTNFNLLQTMSVTNFCRLCQWPTSADSQWPTSADYVSNQLQPSADYVSNQLLQTMSVANFNLLQTMSVANFNLLQTMPVSQWPTSADYVSDQLLQTMSVTNFNFLQTVSVGNALRERKMGWECLDGRDWMASMVWAAAHRQAVCRSRLWFAGSRTFYCLFCCNL